MDLASIRKTYSQRVLNEDTAAPEPLHQLRQWLDEAIEVKAEEPTAMVLATVDANGQPAARVVLLKGLEQEAPGGLVFFTNYESRKGRALAAQPRAAVTFFWPALERQVRIEGLMEQVAPEISEAYFQSRPRASQIGAWASPQSQPVSSRAALEAREAEMEVQFEGQEVLPRPPHWGGYVLRPHYIEFWQGRPSRLHDRLAYERQPDGSWRRQRLAP